MSSPKSSNGCMTIFVLGGLIWGVCLIAHIGNEQNIIDHVIQRTDEIKRVPPEALTDSDLVSQEAELNQLVALDSAARRSQYDPLWFLNGSP